jgi:hypothetical protein
MTECHCGQSAEEDNDMCETCIRLGCAIARTSFPDRCMKKPFYAPPT